MTLSNQFLERFDGETDPDEPVLTYEDGYLAGYDAGRAAVEDGQTQATQDLTDAVSKVVTDLDEAKAKVIEALDPLLRAISDSFLPTLVNDMIGPNVTEALLEKAQFSIEAGCTPHVAEADFAKVQHALSTSGLATQPYVDHSLSPGSFVISTVAEETLYDLNEIVIAIQSALQALTHQPDGAQHD